MLLPAHKERKAPSNLPRCSRGHQHQPLPPSAYTVLAAPVRKTDWNGPVFFGKGSLPPAWYSSRLAMSARSYLF
jgi:hypothetical protein